MEESEGALHGTPRGTLSRRSSSFPARGSAACMVDPNPVAQVAPQPAQQPERVEELRDPRRTTVTNDEDNALHKANVLARVGRATGRRGSTEVRGSTNARQSTAAGVGGAAGMAQLSIVDLNKKPGGYGFTCAQKGPLMVVFDVDASGDAAAAGVEVGDQLMMVQDLEGQLPPKSPGQVTWVEKHTPAVVAVIRGSKRCRFFFKVTNATLFTLSERRQLWGRRGRRSERTAAAAAGCRRPLEIPSERRSRETGLLGAPPCVWLKARLVCNGH